MCSGGRPRDKPALGTSCAHGPGMQRAGTPGRVLTPIPNRHLKRSPARPSVLPARGALPSSPAFAPKCPAGTETEGRAGRSLGELLGGVSSVEGPLLHSPPALERQCGPEFGSPCSPSFRWPSPGPPASSPAEAEWSTRDPRPHRRSQATPSQTPVQMHPAYT